MLGGGNLYRSSKPTQNLVIRIRVSSIRRDELRTKEAKAKVK